jgi:hypothetical protein
MIALIGSEKPSEKELLEGGPPPVVTTLSKYGKVNIGKENLATVLIDKLKAQTPFVIYAIA